MIDAWFNSGAAQPMLNGEIVFTIFLVKELILGKVVDVFPGGRG